jgi:hypothetical protein
MPRVFRSCLTAAALLVCSAATFASAQARNIEELTRKSGLWEQVGQLRVQMVGGVIEARRQAQAANQKLMDDATFARLTGAIDRSFSPELLRETMTLYMEENLAPADEAEVMRWLSSDLGQRFTRMEVEAGDVKELQKAEKEAPRLRAALSAARLEKYRRLATSLDAGSTTATLTIHLTSAIIFAIALVTPDTDADLAANEIRRRMEMQRPQMMQFFGERALQTYSYVYRNANDAQVETYVKFAETAAARRYHAAGIKSLDQTISQAANAMAQELRAPAQAGKNPG